MLAGGGGAALGGFAEGYVAAAVVAVMVCGEDVLMGSKVFGVAMAAAVLIDATVVRGVLLSTPAWRCSATGPGRCPARAPEGPEGKPPSAWPRPVPTGAPGVNVAVRAGSDKDW